jgi:uncharacterized OsmC-like protein
MEVEKVSIVPRSAVSVAINARGHVVVQDKPHENGGADQGLMASELLLGSLLACQHSTFTKIATKRRVDIFVKEIHGEMVFGAHSDIETINVHFVLNGGDEVARATVMRLASKTCTISRAMAIPVMCTQGLEDEPMFPKLGFQKSVAIPKEIAISK